MTETAEGNIYILHDNGRCRLVSRSTKNESRDYVIQRRRRIDGVEVWQDVPSLSYNDMSNSFAKTTAMTAYQNICREGAL